MDNHQSFQYTYSAAQQQEIENIRRKYLPKSQSKMEQLRLLDRIPSQRANAWAIALGVIGALLLGTGMSLFMTEFGAFLGMLAMPVGIVTGVLGLVLAALAYPVYNRVLKKERARIAPEVLRLSDELLK